MYFKFSFLFVIINSFILNAQNLDKLTGLSDNYLKKEIRIYKDRGITNSGVVFRVYKNSKQWNAETIQWFLPKEISSNEIQIISPITKNISADKNIELIFMTLEALNIGQLPMEDAFEYKKEKKSIIWDEDEKGFVMQTSKISILDGNSYSVIYKAGQYYNEFTYNNPESYLQKFPEIDELKSFQKILEYIREQFNLNF